MHDHRGALGRVAVLVHVGRDRGHAGDAEVERRYASAQPLEKGEHEAAQTRVGVERDAALGGQPGQLLDRVDDAERVAGCGADDECGALVDQLGRRPWIGAQVVVQRDLHVLQAQVERRLGESRVRALGREQYGPLDAPLLARALARALGRHQDALGPARGHAPARVLAVEQPRRHRDHVGLHLAQAREAERVERVLVHIELVRLGENAVDLLAGGVDQAPGAAAAPVGVAPLGLAHAREELFARGSLLRQTWLAHRPSISRRSRSLFGLRRANPSPRMRCTHISRG